MILDPKFEEALEGKLPDAEWQRLVESAKSRQELAEHLRMDALLRVRHEPAQLRDELSDAIIATTQSGSLASLEQRIIASTRSIPVVRPRVLWIYPAAAVAVLAMLAVGAAGWMLFRAGPLMSLAKITPKQVLEQPAQPAPAPSANVVEPIATPIAPPPMIAQKPPSQAPVTQRLPAKKPMPEVTTVIANVAPAPVAPNIVMASKSRHESVIQLPTATQTVDFEQHVLPILERSCFECHSAKIKKPKGGVRLDDAAAIREKSKTDSLIFPHKPDKSRVLTSLLLPEQDSHTMPPSGEGVRVSSAEADVIRRWIQEGADFGSWTSARAKAVVLNTLNEAIDAANVAATAQRIDSLMQTSLEAHGQTFNPPANDATWARRLYLDLLGRTPTLTELTAYLNDKGTDKSAKLIDRLLLSDGHASRMFNYWADLLRARGQLADGIDGKPYLQWIKQTLRANKPYDVWVRELLSPEGHLFDAPATGYYLRDGANRMANIEATASVFLGVQIGCAQCHDHPYDQWSRMDYHTFMAFTSGIKASNDDSDVGMVSNEMIDTVAKRYERLSDRPMSDMSRRQRYQQLADKVKQIQGTAGGKGVVNVESPGARLPADYQYDDARGGGDIMPAVLFGPARPVGTRPADALAQWIASPTNPKFNLTIVNRLWDMLFGAPFAGDVDKVKELADCDAPDLAAYLANLPRDSAYDIRQMLRVLCNTRAYRARAAIQPAEGAYLFQGPLVRRLSGEQIWDSLMALAVKDLDQFIDLEGQDTKKLEEARKIKSASELSRIARQMVGEDQRRAEDEARRLRKFGEMSQEFAGGKFARASELPQPAPLGHFLRMFGQGNRDFINDGWREPTVPQSLMMLNSSFFDHVSRAGSPLAEAIRTGVGPAGGVKNAFLAILGREPTKAELDLTLKALDGTRNPKAIARTLVITAEFVFQR